MKYYTKNQVTRNRYYLGFFLFLAFSFASVYGFSQTRNFEVEGDGDQMAVIQSLPDLAGGTGSAGLELIRGDGSGHSDWRIINDRGDLRLQITTDNFATSGSNFFTILEDGNTGIGCSNPQAKLSICSGEIGFSNAFSEDAADKISLDGYRFDQTDMVGLGYETSLVAGPGGIVEFSDLYFKTEGSHRWYIESNADLGASASMVLDNDGNLGVGMTSPQKKLDVFDGARISDVSNTDLELFSTQNNRVEAEFFNNTGHTKLSSFWGDLYFSASTTGGNGTDMAIDAATGNVGIGTISPNQKLEVIGDARLSGGQTPKLELYNDMSFQLEAVLQKSSTRTILSSYNSDLAFRTDDSGSPSTRMTIDATDGHVGIGTQTPATRLQVSGGTDAELGSGGYVQLGSVGGANLVMDQNEIMARDNGAGTTLFVQNEAGDVLICGNEMGQVGIGVISSANMPDDEYLLAVDGKIIAEEVRVELSTVWPDYVFKPEYKLMSIEELESSINNNGHLPGIPSAAQVEQEGIELGDMQKRMMEKIEELSLYIIQQNKEINNLNERLDGLTK